VLPVPRGQVLELREDGLPQGHALRRVRGKVRLDQQGRPRPRRVARTPGPRRAALLLDGLPPADERVRGATNTPDARRTHIRIRASLYGGTTSGVALHAYHGDVKGFRGFRLPFMRNLGCGLLRTTFPRTRANEEEGEGPRILHSRSRGVLHGWGYRFVLEK
jgi:hypothetical protein